MTTTINLFVSLDQFKQSVADRFAEPVQQPQSTVAGLSAYPAASWTGCTIYVSNGTGNKRLAVSDGTNWRFPDGNVVS